jgi:hypothetical protein
MSDISISVTCLTCPGPPINGRLANLSAHGLSIILKCELPTGSVIKVEWGSSEFVGELIYCQPYGNEFLLGLNVENPVYDTKKAAANSKTVTKIPIV